MKMSELDSTIYMFEEVYEEMIAYCKEQIPIEACGLISGVANYGFQLWKIENQLKSRYRFSMSWEAINQSIRMMEEQSEQLTGIFHSHPDTPATPSKRDIVHNPYPELAYIIVSFKGGIPHVECFRMVNNKVEPLILETL